jgi:hypothetical protein
MKRKSLLLTAVATIGLTAATMAQTVPNYVPTNGLVGWWPFNGNANDESGNGNNGTVNGATLTTDRFGNANKAYSFDGVNDWIESPNNSIFFNDTMAFSVWGKFNTTSGFHVTYSSSSNGSYVYSSSAIGGHTNTNLGCGGYGGVGNLNTNLDNNWHNLVGVISGNTTSFYLDGLIVSTWSNSIISCNDINNKMYFGVDIFGSPEFSLGIYDDIGIWNRALTQEEITLLYNSCSGNEIITQPVNTIQSVGSNAQFNLNAVTGCTYQWQNNPINNGWQNVPNNANYSGGTTNNLTVNNVQLSNHNQPFRVIATSGNCIDTSNIAIIQIADTCITNVTIYDTLLTTVTDTLIINTTLSLPAPNNQNTILIYPNPASDHITIDNGNYTAMAGYSIKIENNAGQQVFQSAVNQPQFYIDLSTWSGNGLYFVHLIDPQNNTVTVRKIVLQ